MTKNTEPLNLTKTQRGYVPLKDRFKSFPKDSEKEPITDSKFFFDNRANSTLEHAEIGLLFPTPEYIRHSKNKQGLEGSYVKDNDGNFLVGNNHYVVGVEKK